jgi:UDP-GlcNAc:undecaprenyl-phosphate/decaprenyl-phosphate GlcNAc-1-phosphate transferase
VFEYLRPVGAAALVAVIGTLIMRDVAQRAGAVAPPRADRWGADAIPLLGGVALLCATFGVTFLLTPFSGAVSLIPLAVAGAGAFLIGLIDDLVPIKPASKLTGQIAVGCGVVALGLNVPWTGSSAIDALITLAWFVAITNAFNLLDNMDGLCAGVAAIAAVAVCARVADPGAPAFIFAASLAGASLGFLLFNFRPASIFMGDSGSLFLGASLAVLSLEPRAPDMRMPAALVAPVLLVLIPIFDTLFVILSRELSAKRVATGGRDHTSHRLVALGLSERQAVLLFYTVAAAGGTAAVALERARPREAGAVIGLLIVVLVLLAVHLGRVRIYGDDFAALKDKAFTPLLMEMTYKRRVFEVLLDLVLVAVAYYGAYIIRFDDQFPDQYNLFVTSLPVVIACQLVSFFVAGVYRGVWHYFTGSDVLTYVKGVALGTVSSILALLYLYRFVGYSRTVFIVDAMALVILLTASRYSFRLVGDLSNKRRPGTYRVAIYGAGEGGVMLVRELRRNPRYEYVVVGFIDDDNSKAGKRLAGLPVFGGVDRLPRLIAERALDLVIISTDKLEPARLARLQQICFESGTGLLQFDFRLRPMGVPAAL